MAKKIHSLMTNLAHLVQRTWVVFVVFASLALVAALTNTVISTADNISLFARLFGMSILLYGFIILICAIVKYYTENNSIMVRFFYIVLMGFLTVLSTGLGLQVCQYVVFLSNFVQMSLHIEAQDFNTLFNKVLYINVDSIKKYIRQIMEIKELSIVIEIFFINIFFFTFSELLRCIPSNSFKVIINLPYQLISAGNDELAIRKKDLSLGFLYKAIP